MLILVGCLVAHGLLADIVPSPWWVPDVTLVGLVLAIGRLPRHWLLFSATAGISMMAWAVRFPQPVFVGYLGFGGVVRLLARQVDANDLRVQCFTAGLASAALSLGALWLDGLWSFSLLGLASGRVLLTAMAVPLARRLLVSGQVAK